MPVSACPKLVPVISLVIISQIGSVFENKEEANAGRRPSLDEPKQASVITRRREGSPVVSWVVAVLRSGRRLSAVNPDELRVVEAERFSSPFAAFSNTSSSRWGGMGL